MEALDRARVVLKKRIADPKAQLFGLSGDLTVILAAFNELEKTCGVLAHALLHRHYWPDAPMNRASWASLEKIADHSAREHGTGKHDEACECQLCCLRRMVEVSK